MRCLDIYLYKCITILIHCISECYQKCGEEDSAIYGWGGGVVSIPWCGPLSADLPPYL